MKREETKRIDWIDTLRGLAMFFVLWGHSFPNKKWSIGKYIYSFHMPLFFFISGLTFRDSDKLSLKDFFKKRVKSLLIPYLVVNIVCYFIRYILSNYDLIESFDFLDYFIGIFVSHGTVYPIPSAHSWFITTLFLAEMLFYFLKKKSSNDYNLGISVAVCGLIGYANSISSIRRFLPLHFDTVFTAVVFYYLGYLFMKNIKSFDKLFNSKFKMLICGGALGIIGFVSQYFNDRISMHGNLYGSITLFYISSLATTLGFILFVNLFMKKSKLFNSIGKNTLFYLAYHGTLIRIVIHTHVEVLSSNVKIFAFAVLLTLIMYPFALLVKRYTPVLIGKFN